MSSADRPLAPADGAGGLSAAIAAGIAKHVPDGAALCVGFSGGLDSTVLLDCVAREALAHRWQVRALHVHHGLSPNADAWAQACEAFCRARAIPLDVVRVEIDRGSPAGLEAAAREARYAAFAARPEPHVVLAHHLDDQAETVLLQLLRGTGVKGVAAMPESRPLGATSLVRPLLGTPREALLAYARAHGLAWVEDESNAGTRFDRNYLRHAVAPAIAERFPNWRQSLARFSRHAAEADALLQEVAAADGAVDAASASMTILPRSSDARRANAVRAFLARHDLPMPTEARLREIVRQAYDAADDREVCIAHGGVLLRRHRRRLYVERAVGAPQPWRVAWQGEAVVELGGERGQVVFRPRAGEGLAARLVASGTWHLGPRAGGERVRLAEGRPTRTLKNLLQEHDVAPWARQNLPLLFRDGRLAWIPFIGVAAELACREGEPGLLPGWNVARGGPM